MDTAEHMYAKWKQLNGTTLLGDTEVVGDLFYEIGKDALTKNNYELAIKWLERAYDALSEQDLNLLSPEASELRLSIMHSIGSFIKLCGRMVLTLVTVQSHLSLKTPDGHTKGCNMVRLIKTDYGDRMVVFLSQIDVLSAAQTFDSDEFCDGRVMYCPFNYPL
jgi:predicted nucleic acid-binding protein